jgi:hypothetical protein
MKTSIWYHTQDRNPVRSGYYMAFRTTTLADDTIGVDYFYWNHTGGMNGRGEWRTDHTCHSQWANVYYWTESDPEQWADQDGPVRNRKSPQPSNPAVAQAWADVETAVERYRMIQALTK